MAVTVYVPTPYRGLTAGAARVRVAGQDLAEAIEELEARYPGFRDRVCDDGHLKHHVNVFLNGEEVRSLAGLRTPLKDGDEVAIIPALAGGS
jgi:molybdopterin synthase sulfur carrier subunit